MVRSLASFLLLLGFCGLTSLDRGAAAAQQNSTSAKFLSQTKITLVNQSAQGNTHSYTYSLAFPTKTSGTFVVTEQLNQRYTPNARDLKSSHAGPRIYGLTFKASPKSPNNAASLKFFVPYSSLPPDVVKKLQALARPPFLSDGPSRFIAVRYSMDGQGNQEGSESSGTEGTWIEILQTLAEEGSDQAEEQLNQFLQLEGEGTGGTLTQLVFSGLDVNKALVLNAKDADLLAQELAYLDCANNPSLFSPLQTFDAQQLQNQAQSIYNQTLVDIAVQFATSMAGQIASLLGPSETPEIVLTKLGAAGGFASIGQNFDQLIEQDLQALRQLYPLCKGSWYGTFQVTTTSTNPAYTTTFVDAGTFHFATQLGTNLKGIISGHGKFNQGGPIKGAGGFSYTGTIYGQTQPGLGTSPGAKGNLNAVMNTGPVSPTNFNVSWTTSVPVQEIGLPQPPSTGPMPTPTYGDLALQLQDGVTSSGEYPPPNSPYYNIPGTMHEHYIMTVHQLK